MTRGLLIALGLLLLVAGWRTFAVGRKQARTETERRRDAWGGMPVAYRQTQPGKPWFIRMARRDRARRQRA